MPQANETTELGTLIQRLRRRPGRPWFAEIWGILDGNNTEDALTTTAAGPSVALSIPLPFERSLAAIVMVDAHRASTPASAAYLFYVLWRRPAAGAPVLIAAVDLLANPAAGAGTLTVDQAGDVYTWTYTPPVGAPAAFTMTWPATVSAGTLNIAKGAGDVITITYTPPVGAPTAQTWTFGAGLAPVLNPDPQQFPLIADQAPPTLVPDPAVIAFATAATTTVLVEAPFVGTELTFGIDAATGSGTVLVSPPAPALTETHWSVRALLIGSDG